MLTVPLHYPYSVVQKFYEVMSQWLDTPYSLITHNSQWLQRGYGLWGSQL